MPKKKSYLIALAMLIYLPSAFSYPHHLPPDPPFSFANIANIDWLAKLLKQSFTEVKKRRDKEKPNAKRPSATIYHQLYIFDDYLKLIAWEDEANNNDRRQIPPRSQDPKANLARNNQPNIDFQLKADDSITTDIMETQSPETPEPLLWFILGITLGGLGLSTVINAFFNR